MATSWRQLKLLQASNAPRRSSRGYLLVAAAVCALPLAWWGLSRRKNAPPSVPVVMPALKPAPERPAAPRRPSGDEERMCALFRYLDEKRAGTKLGGVELYERGEYVEAAGWLEQFLKTSPADHVDVALLHLGRSYARAGRLTDAVLAYKRLASEQAASLLAGEALYELGKIAVRAKKYSAAQEYLERAWRTYPESAGGRKSALILADGWYERYCGSEPVRSRWEKIRDAYSVAIDGVEDPDRREETIERLNRLNEWLIFGPGACRNACYYVVRPGESLSCIAARFGVPVGAVKRLNGIPPTSNIVRAGQRLKILRGTLEISISKARLKLTATFDGKFFREYPVGIGAPDRSPTPEGTFTVTKKVVNPAWYYRGRKIPFGDPRNILGTRWMGFNRKGPGSGYGLHGTTIPDTIPGRKSGGCVRMYNEDVEELFDFAPIGTKVVIRAN